MYFSNDLKLVSVRPSLIIITRFFVKYVFNFDLCVKEESQIDIPLYAGKTNKAVD